ncbi:MAG: hypothetical protein QME60_05580 [Verrucomicrobiota bacterium]|nr:hypothetical protein [Verrucomicrobiota bacterium]
MRRSVRLFVFSGCALTAAALVLAAAGGDVEVPALQGKGFRYPIERYANGQPKVVLIAGQIAAAGCGADRVAATDARVEFYTETGLLDGLLTTPECCHNKASNTVSSASAIVFQKGAASISGNGFEWNITQRIVRVFQNARVVIPAGKSFAPVALPPGNGAKEEKP